MTTDPTAAVRDADTVANGRRTEQPGAKELRAQALERYHRDHVAHMRAELAVRVVDTEVPLVEVPVATDDGTIGTGRVRVCDDLDLARLGAAVALELVERDRDTTEAKLARARNLAEAWLTGRVYVADQATAARALLTVLGDRA